MRDIVEFIAAGDVYQVNVSQRFRAPFHGDPFTLFRRLLARNPAPFFAFVQGGDHQVVSTSPERFLQRAGDRVESRPIKGTRPRGTTPEQDRALRDELLASAKDDAELSMIVDLVRNDLGKVCRPGTVQVAAHKQLESYRNVHHLVSTVTGELDPGLGTVDLLRAAFPAGSITGCPKIRAMEIIDQLEAHRRHVYCGSIGYVGFDETLDLSIAIRTATITGDPGHLVGGRRRGVRLRSGRRVRGEPAQGTHPGRGLRRRRRARTHRLAQRPAGAGQSQASVPGDRPGPAPGLRPVRDPARRRRRGAAAGGSPGPARGLVAHPHAQPAAGSRLGGHHPPGGGRQRAGRPTGPGAHPGHPRQPRQAPWDHSLTVTAEPYTHRLVAFGVPALNLATYPEPRQTPLAAHKTLSYIYYIQAGAWATGARYHEALILNPDGTVSEGNSSGLVVIKGLDVVRPSRRPPCPASWPPRCVGNWRPGAMRGEEAPVHPRTCSRLIWCWPPAA